MIDRGASFPEGTFPLSRIGFEGRQEIFPLVDQGTMSISEFAKALVEGQLKGGSGESVYLFDLARTGEIVKALDQLAHHQGKLDFFTHFLISLGIGSFLLAAVQKSGERVPFSTVAPKVAKVIRRIGKSL